MGGAAMAARTRASGVWEEESSVGDRPSSTVVVARDHTRERKRKGKKGKEGKRGVEGVGRGAAPVLLLLLTRVVVRSVGSRRAPLPVPPEARPFESCMLTMRTERGVGLRPPEKGPGVCT